MTSHVKHFDDKFRKHNPNAKYYYDDDQSQKQSAYICSMACCLLFGISRHQDNATAGITVALIKLKQNCTFNIMHIIREALIHANPESFHINSEDHSFK